MGGSISAAGGIAGGAGVVARRQRGLTEGLGKAAIDAVAAVLPAWGPAESTANRVGALFANHLAPWNTGAQPAKCIKGGCCCAGGRQLHARPPARLHRSRAVVRQVMQVHGDGL